MKMLFNKSIVSGGILFCITYSENLLLSNDVFQEHPTGQYWKKLCCISLIIFYSHSCKDIVS